MISEQSVIEEATGLRYLSSVAEDVWHPKDSAAGSYEWWYFDAVSDDGRDALVIIFLANFIFSPRYNRAVTEHLRGNRARTEVCPAEFPAIVVCVYRDGRPVLRAINEYTADAFAASAYHPSCRIGRSSFRLESNSYESTYHLTLDEPVRHNRRLTATLQWTIEDGGLSQAGEASLRREAVPLPNTASLNASAHHWNLVAPRCRVSGSLNVTGRNNAPTKKQRFDGFGYHDHNHDRRPLFATVAEWQWGRAHFQDATAIFYRYRERTDTTPLTRLFIVRGGTLAEYNAHLTVIRVRRHPFGLRYPGTLVFEADADGKRLRLHIRQRRIVDGSYFYLRFLSEATLDLGDGHAQRAPAITEHLAPRALGWRWLDWLTDMRIGRNGRGSFLP